jgi:hypothetical protein
MDLILLHLIECFTLNDYAQIWKNNRFDLGF